MRRTRDVAAFDDRAGGYDTGRLGQFHHEVASRVAAIARSVTPDPHRVLDVGCGTGYLLGTLAEQYPVADVLLGLDPSDSMTRIARTAPTDHRVEVVRGTAEALPFSTDQFDLIVSTTSFDHWHDQAAGLRECARALTSTGVLVLADLFSPVLAPTLVGARRDKARTVARATRLLERSGLRVEGWCRVHTLVRAAVARRATARTNS